MKSQCVEAVEKTIGRQLKAGEADSIDTRIVANVRELARTDPNFTAMTREQRLMAAAQMGLTQAAEAAAKTAQRKASNLTTQLRESQALNQRAGEVGGSTPFHRALAQRMNQLSHYIGGVRSELVGGMMDAIHAAEPKFLGLMHDAQAMRDFC